MFAGLFASSTRRGHPSVPSGHRIYAIGDVHGRDDLLLELLGKIESDIAARPAARNAMVFLGDLIDRGPASAEVVERMRRYRPNRCRTIFLMGNHEEVLLRILAGEHALIEDWLQFGGAECMRSYGIEPSQLKRVSTEQAAAMIRDSIPKAHVEFLEGFADTFRAGDFLFVHAGIRPGVPLDQQAQQDLRWIRRPFLDDRSETGTIVVHGHTINEAIDEQPNRIGIDTGAYYSGVLTAIGIQNAERWFLQTGENSDIGEISPFLADSQQ